MAYSVSPEWREQCYSGESIYDCILTIGENTIPSEQISSITISSPIIDDQTETFYIGTFISQKLTIEFKNLDGIDTTSGTNVELSIKQYVNDDWETVPIGKFLIDESPENYYQSAKIECLDYAIKFATNLDYSPCFVDGKTTIDTLLAWICTHYGVTLGSYPNTNGDVEITTFDSTVSGKRWISYIAEIKACNAKMDRLGQLTLVPLKSAAAVTIDATEGKEWELGEKYQISQVIFFDAIRNYTYPSGGDDSENTLYIRQDNPFIVDESVVSNIYDEIYDTVIWNIKCENYGDVSLDAWDTIAYTVDEDTYYTLNNNTITYEMTIMSKTETKIPTKQQEVTTNVVEGTEEQRYRRLGTEINKTDNAIRLYAEDLSETEEKVTQLEIDSDRIESSVQEVSDTLTSKITILQSSTSLKINALNQTIIDGVPKVTNSLIRIDDNGVNVSKSDETFNTQMTNKTFEVKDGDTRLGFLGFDSEKQKTIVEFPEMQTSSLTCAYHVTEKIEEDNLLWSADYYVGGDI